MADPLDNGSGLSLRLGTYEEGLAMVGAVGATREAHVAANTPMVELFCAAVEDANASYWDEAFAREQWGGPVAPPAMLQAWAIAPPWRPDGVAPAPSLSMQTPLPGDKPVNLSSDAEFFLPVNIGDRLNYTETLISISPQKQTRIGVGHFIETLNTVRNQRGDLVARVTNVLFRYRTEGSAP